MQDLGKLYEAAPLMRQALAIRKKVRGEGHPNVANSLHCYACLLQEQGRAEEASRMGKQALAIFEKALGADHPNTQTATNNLARELDLLDQVDEAEAMHRRFLPEREERLGPTHHYTVLAEFRLALFLWKKRKRYAEALSLFREAATGASAHPAPRSPGPARIEHRAVPKWHGA